MQNVNIQLHLYHNGSPINIFEAVAIMADNLPDPKLKAKLFRHGSSCVLAEIGYTLSSCEQWEEMFKQDKKSKNRQQKFKQHVEQTLINASTH